LLIGVSTLPCVLGITGRFYLWGALIIGLGMLWAALDFACYHGMGDARRLLKASVLYLPLLLLLIVLDVT
jgi:protoheme IX farnesyltransferase